MSFIEVFLLFKCLGILAKIMCQQMVLMLAWLHQETLDHGKENAR